MKKLIYASSFNRAIEHMNSEQMCFITAFRGENSHKENLRRNSMLESDIRASGLSYMKANGGYIENKGVEGENRVKEATYAVINNKYPMKEFTKLMVNLCGKYQQEAILITTPTHTNTSAINVSAKYYDSNGNITMEFNNATVSDVDEYFTNICGKDFVFSDTELHHTVGHDINTIAGKILGKQEFEYLYPDL